MCGKLKKLAPQILIALFLLLFFSGCVTLNTSVVEKNTTYLKPSKTVAEYENAGRWWGAKHWNEKRTPTNMVIDEPFVTSLIDPNNLDFFWVHSDLKEAFVKGYRLGYQDRTADLVLGPNITEAAARIGFQTSSRFVEVINAFERDWAETLRKAINVFITLISEGSQADREDFIIRFVQVYSAKFSENQSKLKAGDFLIQESEGGTMLHIDSTKTLAVLDIPRPEVLKTEIYLQTFKVMGDEWGRRFSHNLIKREELVNLLRRSKTALQEVPEGLSDDARLRSNMRIIHDSFVKSYGTDADFVFQSLIKDAGYNFNATPGVLDGNKKRKWK